MNIQVLSDQHLLNNYRSGDQSAISKLIERHKRRVRDYIYMMVKDNDVADEHLPGNIHQSHTRHRRRPLHRQRQVPFVGSAYRAQPGDRPLPRLQAEQAGQ